MSVNKVILVGRVGKDPEVKTVKDDKKVASFSLATDDFTKDSEGKSKTTWHNISVWDKLAEVTEKFVKKGSQLYIEGRISHDEYTDKEGVKRIFTRITATQIDLLGSKKDSQDSGDTATDNAAPAATGKPAAKPSAKASTPAPAMADSGSDVADDLPF